MSYTQFHDISSRPPAHERPLFHVIHGLDTAEQFDSINHSVERRAKKYWGIDKGSTLIPVRDDDLYRLDVLNATLQGIDGIEPELQTWRKKTSVNKAQQNMHRKIVYPTKMLPNVCIEPVEAIEIFDQPDINAALMEELDYRGDPTTAVIRRYENWRVAHDAQEGEGVIKTDPKSLERGYRAFELFLFGAGGSRFLEKLKTVSINYFSENPEKYSNFVYERKQT
jgi:hypothetical protein